MMDERQDFRFFEASPGRSHKPNNKLVLWIAGAAAAAAERIIRSSHRHYRRTMYGRMMNEDDRNDQDEHCDGMKERCKQHRAW